MPDEFDYETKKLEYLQLSQDKLAGVQHMLDGIGKIREGGMQSFQEVALSHPDVMFAAFCGLVDVIEVQNAEIIELTESWFRSLDTITNICKSHEAMVKKIQAKD